MTHLRIDATNPDRPPYSDRCPECIDRVIVPPLLVGPDSRGVGLVADYACPSGHTWHTGWQPREDLTDEEAA